MNVNQPPTASGHRQCLSGLRKRYLANLVLFGALLLLGLGLVALGLAKPRSKTLLPGVIFVAAAVVPLVPVFVGSATGVRRVELTADGLAWEDGKGERGCRWDEVEAVYREETVFNYGYPIRSIRLVLSSGEAAKFDQRLRDYDRLAEAIQNVTGNLLAPRKRQELAAGAAAFGPVTLHPDGITVRAKRFAWAGIDEYTVCQGILFVFPTGYKGQAHERVELDSIPNYLVLLGLLREQGRDPVPAERSILSVGRKTG
jgi:hypothetical protein